MNWLNIELRSLRSESFVGAEPLDRATWLCLMAFCADQENGGTISGAAEWGDRKWMQLVGITKDESRRACPLWTWDKDSLTVAMYPADKESEIQAKREAGKSYGRGKQSPKTVAPPKVADSSANSSAMTELELEGNEKGNRKEDNTPLPPCQGEPPAATAIKPKTRFVPPTIEEVREYCRERANGVDADKWHNYYAANGWKVGRNSMKDWRAAVRTWEGNRTPVNGQIQKPRHSVDPEYSRQVAEFNRSGKSQIVEGAGESTVTGNEF